MTSVRYGRKDVRDAPKSSFPTKDALANRCRNCPAFCMIRGARCKLQRKLNTQLLQQTLVIAIFKSQLETNENIFYFLMIAADQDLLIALDGITFKDEQFNLPSDLRQLDGSQV